MSRNFYKCILLLLISVSYSCGPKKGIVTKKKNQKKTTEVVITESSPEVEAVSKAQEKDQPTETPIRSKTPSGSGSSVDIYIADFAEISKVEMQKYKIPASITLAQGILESGAGKGRLAREANNHFGIKCHDWTGDRIYHDDDRSGECFRKYRNPEESYEDHSKFLTQRRRYAPLFELRQDDYKGWARGLKKAGYATDRNYPKKLIGLIERYELHKYDDEVLNGPKKITS
jgi:flagellum-specific peptidoglycan hydrolase FlgJ